MMNKIKNAIQDCLRNRNALVFSIISLLLIGSIVFELFSWVRTGIFLVWIICLLWYRIGDIRVIVWKKLFFVLLELWVSCIVMGLILYFAKAMAPLWVGVFLFIYSSIQLYRPRIMQGDLKDGEVNVKSVHASLYILVPLYGFLLLFGIVMRTGAPLITPWFLYPFIAFVFYFLATLCLIIFHAQYSRLEWFILSILHVFISVSVSALVYKIGFGFDPFIHRAAEMALIQNGFILPGGFLYSGQYGLIGFLHFATGFSVTLLDIWYVPILTTFTLPTLSYLGLKNGWKASESVARMGWIGALIVPYMLLTFSVPFTYTYLLFILLLFIFPLFRLPWDTHTYILLFFFLSGLFFHPLLLIPSLYLIVRTVFAWRVQGLKRIGLESILIILFSCLLIVLLAVYQYASGSEISFAMDRMTNFSSLFINIFGGWNRNIPWFLNTIYILRYWVPIIVCITGIIILLCYGRYRKNISEHTYTFFLFSILLLVNIFGVSTLFVFQNIIAHEQQEFALRLLQALYTSGCLGLGIGMGYIFGLYNKTWRIIGGSFFAFLITLAWYFSYPQFNAKFAYTSPSVSEYDVQAVRTIDAYVKDDSYLVLSNQMMSAGALQELGFKHYITLHNEKVLWYAIPTGGILYQYYLAVLFGGNMQTLDLLHKDTNVEYIVVAVHTYWQLEESTMQWLEKYAHDTLYIDNQIILYIFHYET